MSLKSYKCRLAHTRWKMRWHRCRLATLEDPGTPDQIVLDQHSLTHFPSLPWCKVCVEFRGRDSPHREQSKNVTQWCHNFRLSATTWRRMHPTDCVFPGGNRHLFWTHVCDNGARLQEDGRALRGFLCTQIPTPKRTFLIVLAFRHQQVKLLTASHQHEALAR